MVKDYPPQPGRPGYVVVRAMDTLVAGEEPKVDHANYIVIRDCPFCGMEARTKVPAQGLWDWEHGTFVQEAFPDLSVNEREQIMTGTHAACWNTAFPPEHDELPLDEHIRNGY